MLRIENETQYVERIHHWLERIKKQAILTATAPLQAQITVDSEPIPFKQRLTRDYKTIVQGERWGNAWDSAWIHITGAVPTDWMGCKVVAHLDFNGEAALFDDDGMPLYGLTNGSVFLQNFSKDILPLFDCASGGEKVDLWIEAAANHLFGLDQDQDPQRSCPRRHGDYAGKVNAVELAIFDEETYHFMHDLDILASIMDSQEKKSPRRRRIIATVNRALDIYGESSENIVAARTLLNPLLTMPAHASDLTVCAIGHAHIDTGWLWPVRESIRKCGRTFASQLALMEKYPDYVFGASQPQHYQFIKDHYPALFDKIKSRVKEGRWELQGAMWVEADCNLISGESMVRQFIHGKNFFMDEFGFDVKNLWLPDVFGYSANLPQIMKRSGVDFFLTQKLSWNQCNEHPFDSFNWQGIDGSTVLTHFPPEADYNSLITPTQLKKGQDNFKENHLCDEFLSLFGIGNGGGGPKEEYIERALRCQNIAGSPKVRMGRADDFFNRLNLKTDQLNTWVGELYLELHRGTLTTQAKIKKGNRKLELMLRTVEAVFSCGALDDYPLEQLQAIWKKLLINQFHDILPGSSIKKVYETTEQEYADAMHSCQQLLQQAAKRLFNPAKDQLVLFNPLSTPVTKAVELPSAWSGFKIETEAKTSVTTQSEPEGCSALLELPAYSFTTLTRKEQIEGESFNVDDELILENSLIRYRFAADGTIIEGYDKEAQRSIMCKGQIGNRLALYVDRPVNWDAWDIDVYYQDQTPLYASGTGHRVITGPVRQGLEFQMQIGKSTVRQWIYLDNNSKRLDFKTEVDWREYHKMLRVSFPVAVNATEASFDIQYGYVKRPIHTNTSWDMMRFETVGQQWADLSDLDYGMALMNDCKYGYRVNLGLLDLNLLRSPGYPDPDADAGIHDFTYAILPHNGGVEASRVKTEAAQLNLKPSCFVGYNANSVAVPVAVEAGNVALEVVKMAEKEQCLIIRLVETAGKTSPAIISFPREIRLIETNLLEWSEEHDYGAVEQLKLTCPPFSIRTFKII